MKRDLIMWKVTKIFAALLLLVTARAWAEEIGQLHNLGYVVVSPNGPDDGGDFGPNTAGTQTSGIQEAFDYAKANTKEVFIIGGGAGGLSADPVIYTLDTTLTIPWGQDWHCDGGNYIMNFTQTSGDCMVVDSQMNCVFKFGVISAPNLGSGSVVNIHPTSIGPDGFIVCVSTKIDIAAIIGGGNPAGGEPGGGTGLQLNTSAGGISFSIFSIGEITGCQTGILLNGGHHNKIEWPRVHVCNTHLQVNSSSNTEITALFQPGGVAGTVIGANFAGGEQNHCNLTWLDSFPAGNALIFGSGAADNLIYAMNLAVNGITNNAASPTNRVVPLNPVGFNVPTPSIPGSGGYIQNTTSYSIIATILTPGSVSSWRIMDCGGSYRSISGSLYAGQSIYLDPGDSVLFYYTTIPTWVWRAIR